MIWTGNILQWEDVELDVTASEFSLVMVANSDNNDDGGSIALDDIHLTPGGCNGDWEYNSGGSSDGGDSGDGGDSSDGDGVRPTSPETERAPSDRSSKRNHWDWFIVNLIDGKTGHVGKVDGCPSN